MMKKILLSFGVVFTFILYALHEKQEASDVHVVTPQLQSSNQTTPIQTPLPTDSVGQPLQSTSTPTPIKSGPTVEPKGQYADGEYTGNTEDAFYGNIQVKAVIQNGKIADVQFLQYPNDRQTSITINQQAMPLLRQEAIKVQSAQVDIVSGATDSSQAFQKSLQSALNQAKG